MVAAELLRTNQKDDFIGKFDSKCYVPDVKKVPIEFFKKDIESLFSKNDEVTEF